MISRLTLLKVFLNSFFIQSAWSFEKMQGLGFAASIAPAVKDIYKNRKDACSAIKRHMVLYNAHPYMASPILGAVIRMEEDVKAGKRDVKDIASFKESLMGPYGAIGDCFFWGSIRPLASIIGVLSMLIWGIWGIVIFLIVYNIFHLWMRWFGLIHGYKRGDNVVDYIQSLKLPEWSRRIRLITTVLLGILAAVAAFTWFKFGISENYHGDVRFLFAVFIINTTIVLSYILKKGIQAAVLIYVLFLPVLIVFIGSELIARAGSFIK